MRVTEIFFSIQGESTHAGKPCVFVRFTGCDLRCGYCDTAYAFHGGKDMSRAEILGEVERHPARFVCLTGGEPVLQKELPDLCRELLARGYEVSLETHGQRPLDAIPREVKKIVDLKTPGSGEEHRDFRELGALREGDELKVVVCGEADFRWAVEVIDRLGLWGRVPVLFSPSFGEVAPQDLARWVLASERPARLQLQMHKIIWGAEARGV
ncbi:MAG: radical SAM protein [Deltaproteobacteria bacterium]|nr:MAG: radical SAM protein [Deltaproteobacteria bacterium]TMB35466.1 MAG: radical SAM protein [Deltaproteobacteria bacterium]